MWKIIFTLLLLDSIYLGIHSSFLSKSISNIGTVQFRPLPALFVYACLTILAQKLIEYRIPNKDVFLLGMCVYGIYEGTNYAVFKNWPPYLFVVDTLWGGILLYLTVRFNRI
jgi:uncharacterized membrane protein